MALEEEIYKLSEAFGKSLAEDLLKSVNQAVDRKSGTPVDLEFNPVITVSPLGVSIKIVSNKPHWYWIENGRRKGKMPPSEVVGKEWQNKVGINARKVILEINAKTRKTTRKPKKTLNYDKAAKTLAFLIARSIGKKGIKPRPFIDKVVNDGRVQQFTKALSELVGKDIIDTIKK